MQLKRNCFLILIGAGVAASAAHGAALSVTRVPLEPGTNIDLTIEGQYDWAHWGTVDATSYDHQDPNNYIGNFVVVGTNVVQQTNALSVGYSWENGAPTLAATNTTTAVYLAGITNGFAFTVPANQFVQRLQVYVGTYLARARFEAILSDGSLPKYVDTTLDSTTGETNAIYVIDFATTNDSQTITLKLIVEEPHDANGSVRLESAVYRSSPTNAFPTITLLSPTNDANLSVSAPVALMAEASDPDGTVRVVEFFDDAIKIGEATNSPFTFVWTNAAAGFHTLKAVATDNFGDIGESSTATVFIYTSGGTLGALAATPPAEIDLTVEGTSDWAHWGLSSVNSFDHKAGVVPQVSNFAPVTFGPAFRFTDNQHGFTWYDGTPTVSATNTLTGVYITGLGDGFEFNVAAGTNLSTLNVYVGTFAARGKLTAFLSDKSTPAYFDASLENSGNGPNAVYTINFKSASPGQTLTVRYTILSRTVASGNVTLIAASLATDNLPPFVAITNIPNHSVFQSPTNIAINATASDPDGTVSNVEFFDGAMKLAELTNAPFDFVWTNAPVGSHSLTARATDNRGTTFTSMPIDLFVTTGGGILKGIVTTPPASVSVSVEGQIDWAHWGLDNANSFNHRSGIASRISDITKIGSGPLKQLTDYAASLSWTNGTPTATSAGTTTGIYIEGLNHGFQITTPADQTLRRLKVYVGLYGARGRFEASLSDFSGPTYGDASLNNVFDNSAGVYTVYFAAASSNQTLNVKYTATELHDADFGNVTFEAATLADTAFAIADLQFDGISFGLSLPTEAGWLYAIEYSDVLPATNWITLTNVIGTGSITNITDPVSTGAQRFYRAKGSVPQQ
jgi:hypothetical protein